MAVAYIRSPIATSCSDLLDPLHPLLKRPLNGVVRLEIQSSPKQFTQYSICLYTLQFLFPYLFMLNFGMAINSSGVMKYVIDRVRASSSAFIVVNGTIV